jgi:hypothetical protein
LHSVYIESKEKNRKQTISSDIQYRLIRVPKERIIEKSENGEMIKGMTQNNFL